MSTYLTLAQLADYEARLQKASDEVDSLAFQAELGERSRLRGKASGLRCALDMLRGYGESDPL